MPNLSESWHDQKLAKNNVILIVKLNSPYHYMEDPPPKKSPDKCLYPNCAASFAITYLVSGLGILISIFILGDLIFACLRNKRNKRLLRETMEKGTQPDVEVSGNELVLRPETIKRLKNILQPYEGQPFYHLVCGEHGTGKTTLIRISSREVGHGVIYVDVPASLDLTKFGDAFGKSLNFIFEEHISYTKQLIRKMFGKTEGTLSKWERALDAFKREAELYKAKNGKPPVIVYDNVGRLVADHPRILDVLQDDAKDSADNRKYFAVSTVKEVS
ncbi:3312_t:CDS:2 [Acaulospora morrowiae]|uniref:3312_t:CDS:1 n=1 Tax=Acaulospora morrowiae TaxID=94023 RepID=A0A9N9AV31_9GLOM|nr:3312_t:CDS:2 [Acaulospora morrowiae]